jgi:hypothetical protein
MKIANYLSVLLLLATTANAHHSTDREAAGARSRATHSTVPSPSVTSEAGVYTPYQFLIGDWEVSPGAGGTPVAVTRFTWGPGKSYIWFATSLMKNGAEIPHFEGMLMWNGVRKNLDMLVTLDLNGGRSQEQGDLSIEPDGTVVRRITAYFSEGLRTQDGRVVGPEGASAKFRQTFKAQGPNRVLTTLLRETPKGWVPSFPGSDKLVMKRRSTGSSG